MDESLIDRLEAYSDQLNVTVYELVESGIMVARAGVAPDDLPRVLSMGAHAVDAGLDGYDIHTAILRKGE